MWGFQRMLGIDETLGKGKILEKIGEDAFEGCTSLELIVIPIAVKVIKHGACCHSFMLMKTTALEETMTMAMMGVMMLTIKKYFSTYSFSGYINWR